MNIVLSIGGSVLAPALDPDRIREYATVITDLTDDGYEVSVVVGGGQIARDYISAARELGTNEISLDTIGIAATRLNARLLIAGIGDAAVKSPSVSYEDAAVSLKRGDIPVMGGVAPAQTTDAVSAALAEYVDAELLVYATSVPGVFDMDPAENGEADRYDELSASQLVQTIVDLEMNAGSSAPVDLLAAKVIQRAKLRTIVLDGTEPGTVTRAIRTGQFEGTRILPEDAEESLQQQLGTYDE